MTTLVTGATGLLGNNLVRALLARDESVRVLVRNGHDPRTLAGLAVEVRQGDIRDSAAVEAAAEGVDSIFHCAALVTTGWQGLKESRAVNVIGSLHVGRAAKKVGARMVHISSIDALGLGTAKEPVTEETPYQPHATSPYPVTKREAEVALLDLATKGLDLVIVNPGFMLGPYDWHPSSGRMLLEVAAGNALFAPAGRNQFCGVTDVVDATIAARDKGRSGERYILTGELLTYYQAFRIFADVTGGRRPISSIGPVVLYAVSKFGDLYTTLTGRESDINSAAIAMTRLPRYFSHTKAAAELNYRPRPIRTSAQQAWEWFLEHGYAQQKSPRAAHADESPSKQVADSASWLQAPPRV